jgi:uncharacterized membrane protein YdjX (TVP38/TMEM64 family)
MPSLSPASWQLVLGLAVLAGLAAAWRFTPLAEVVTAERVTAWTRAAGDHWWAPLALVAALTVACLVLFPRPLITLAAVLVFGPWLGFAYSMAGIMVAALLTFYAGRYVRRDTVRRIAGRKLDRLSAAMRERGLVAMTAVRLVPLAPFPVVGLVAGAIRVKPWHYAAGSFLGNLPGVLAATVFADQIAAALDDSSRVNWWVVGGVLVVLALGTLAVRRWLGTVGERPRGAAG